MVPYQVSRTELGEPGTAKRLTKKKGKESQAACAKRLRRVALKTDRATVRKAVQAPHLEPKWRVGWIS